VTATEAQLAAARLVADAVLYEGYLLYPYRASSSKNAVRWQFGVLGPPAAEPGIGEPPELSTEFLLEGRPALAGAEVRLSLRFLQLQHRQVVDADGEPVAELECAGKRWLSWDEAVAQEIELGPFSPAELRSELVIPVSVPGGVEREELPAGAGGLVRDRLPLTATVRIQLTARPGPELGRLRVIVRNGTSGPIADRDAAIARSLLGCHLLVLTTGARFVSLLEPPEAAAEAAAGCVNERCWPVLASLRNDVLLVSPIILYDHPEVAAESAGPLFDATEIDEILTLRVMTMTEREKAEARATDPHAAAIIDRCDAMSVAELQRLHGVLRDPWPDSAIPTWTEPAQRSEDGTDEPDAAQFGTDGKPWWDPGVDGSVSPGTDALLIDGVRVAKGSRVRVRPCRRADAQDLFFADQEAIVAAVLADVDGNSHVAVVLVDDPAAELHEWYGRYLYFAPEELQPLPDPVNPVSVTEQGRTEPWQH